MKKMISSAWMLFVARVLLSVLFIMAGLQKIGGFDGTVGYVASVGLPFPEVVVVLTIIIEVLGGLMILVGFKTYKAAMILGIFTILTAVFFHANFADPVQATQFLKNLAIAGGFFALAAAGAGAMCLDNRKKAEPPQAM